MKRIIYKNGKHLRYGYTTGSCAAGAAKAAAMMLLSQKELTTVELMTPKGWLLTLDVVAIEISQEQVTCAVVKDSGDDPDMTNGVKVYATVSYSDSSSIKGGLGVGMVTKKGLPVPVGQHAINPVPYKMIKENVEAILNDPYAVVISVPEGVEIAKKTFNPLLGIIGGISIIGTTGIVEPMSEEAFKESLALELKTMSGKNIVLAPGNYGRDYCIEQGVQEKYILKTSNFIGYMLDRVVESKKEKILFVGHIGKLIKVAGGIFHTHSRVSDARMAILVDMMVREQIAYEHLSYVQNCNTTEEAVNYLVDHQLTTVFMSIVEAIKARIRRYTFDAIHVEVILFSSDQGLLAQTDGATEMMEVLYE